MSTNDKFISSQVGAFKNAASTNVNADLTHSTAAATKSQPKLTDKPLNATAGLKFVVTETSVTCLWQYVQYATNYILERADDNLFTINKVTIYSSTGNGFVDSTVKGGQTYYYRVTTAANGYFGRSLSGSTTTLNEIPVTNITISNISDIQITLSWSDLSSFGATDYLFEKSTTANFSSGVTTVYSGSDLSVVATGLSQATHYYFRLSGSGVNHLAVNYAYSDATTLTALVAPTLTFGTITDTTIILNWTLVSGATSYGLERSPNGTNSWYPLYSGNLRTFTDTELTTGTTYYYRVHAIATHEIGISYGTGNVSTL